VRGVDRAFQPGEDEEEQIFGESADVFCYDA
jgi:hypothetical protein